MSKELEKMITDTFSDLKNLNMDKFHVLLQETIKVFTNLNERTQSEDPKVREEALVEATTLKDTFQTQADTICQKLGLSPEQISSFAETGPNFSAAEWERLGGLKQEMDEFKTKLRPNAPKVPAKKSKNKTWLAG